jgi:small subunit ribosomal protein S20
MPIIKSAKKAMRQNERRRKRNLIWKRKIKDIEKKIEKLIKEKKKNEANKLLPQLYKVLDKAAKNNIIKKNKAARLKSRITKFILKSSKKTGKDK